MIPRATSPEERTALLEKTEWARKIPTEDIAPLAAAGEVVDAPAGATLVKEGGTDRWMGVILSGEIEVTGRRLVGEDALLRVMGPGRPVGEFSLLDDQPRSASVVALQPTTLLRWTPEAIDGLVQTEPTAAYRLIKRLGKDLVQRIRSMQQVPQF